MAERVVVNASPMIALLGIGQEGLLPALFDEVLVPAPVREQLDLLTARGFRLSERLVEQLLRAAGEEG